ncbi:jg3775 [Pararge aegeria aegeria]|uniref:Jg3775 protein n=1 Tax=Pararge aegeria aegeria TaxID=348720 RepID=A0A8S4SH90_9NEOP|nr:jg3775 [Pararge aegeria aegeria]
MLEVKFILHCVLVSVVAECQGKHAMSLLSKDSFQQIKRIFMSVPQGRKSQVSDTRIIYYRDSERNNSYGIKRVLPLLSDPTFDFEKPTVFYIHGITALDAAYPGFYPPLQTVPVNPKDADFVDIIHTDGGWFGASTSIGHVDFWPNGGTANQPGCLPFTLPLTVENFCNHWRSWQYWAESVNGGNFIARKCNTYEGFRQGKCFGTAFMGLAATPELRGNYYLRTASQEPFALGESGATLRRRGYT